MENRIKTVLLLAGMTVFLIVIGRLLGGRPACIWPLSWPWP